MVKRVIKKIISVIVISSMLINNTFLYVEARDIKLLKVLLNDAIEDIEYKERESSYKEEHLSFLEESETEETTIDNDTVGAKHREPEADNNDTVEANDIVGANHWEPVVEDSDDVGASDTVGAKYIEPEVLDNDTVGAKYLYSMVT